jgi:hypothetical protein
LRQCLFFSFADMGGHSGRQGRPDRVLRPRHAGTCQTKTAVGEKWRQNQVGNDEAFVHHSRSVRRNETSGGTNEHLNDNYF